MPPVRPLSAAERGAARALLRPAWRLAVAAICGLVLLAARGSGDVFRWDLDGIIVHSIETPGSPLVAVAAVVRAGSLMEGPEEAGLASIVAEVMRARLDAAPPALAGAGLFAVTHDGWRVSLTTRAPATHADAALALIAAALKEPITAGPPFTAAHRRCVEAARAREASPEGVGLAAVEARLFGGRPGGRLTAAALLGGRDAAAAEAFRRRLYVRNNVWLGVASAETGLALEARLRPPLAGWPRRPVAYPNPPPPAPAVPGLQDVPGPGAGGLVFGGLLGGRWDPERHTDRVLLDVLEARLTRDHPLQGRRVEVHRVLGEPTWWWVWLDEAWTPASALAVLDTLARGEIDPAEVEAARRRIAAAAALDVRSPAALVLRYASAEAMGYPGAQWVADGRALARVDTSRVRRAARLHLGAERWVGARVVGAGSAVTPHRE